VNSERKRKETQKFQEFTSSPPVRSLVRSCVRCPQAIAAPPSVPSPWPLALCVERRDTPRLDSKLRAQTGQTLAMKTWVWEKKASTLGSFGNPHLPPVLKVEEGKSPLNALTKAMPRTLVSTACFIPPALTVKQHLHLYPVTPVAGRGLAAGREWSRSSCRARQDCRPFRLGYWARSFAVDGRTRKFPVATTTEPPY